MLFWSNLSCRVANSARFKGQKLKISDYKKIAEILEEGGVMIFPTDTLYGLGCDATNEKAVRKIFKIKSRPKGKGMPVLVRDFKMLGLYAQYNKEQAKIIRNTVIPTTFRLGVRGGLAKNVLENDTGAFRVPRKDFVQNLFKYFKKPIVATSVNRSGEIPLKNPKDFKRVFKENSRLIDLVVDDGINRKKKGSRIVDLTVGGYKIIRK